MSLTSLLDKNREPICETLRLCKENWESLMQTCCSKSVQHLGRFNNEEAWTFLVACGYAIAGSDGVTLLTKQLTGQSGLAQPFPAHIWLEYRPMTPREGEGRTHLDLAIGSINQEPKTTGGIELSPNEATQSWICFCEMKWESDISPGTANDKNRNQLVRVIESALYFQKAGKFADAVFVNLVTPEAFKGTVGLEKLYRSKFEDYKCSNSKILGDLENCSLKLRDQFDATGLIDSLSLQWMTYDDLFDGLPASDIRNELMDFWVKYRSYIKGVKV